MKASVVEAQQISEALESMYSRSDSPAPAHVTADAVPLHDAPDTLQTVQAQIAKLRKMRCGATPVTETQIILYSAPEATVLRRDLDIYLE